jgi:phosphoserine phosphatase RsbX
MAAKSGKSGSDNGKLVRCGVAMRCLPGESVAGDRCVIKSHAEGVVLAVIDGLGHGEDAARAAELAVSVVDSYPFDDPIQIVAECHRSLRRSRGAVMTIMALSAASGSLSAVAVGNVQAMLLRGRDLDDAPERDFVVLRGGVVGHVLPALRSSKLHVSNGDTIVLATDGIRIDFAADEHLNGPPQEVADRILATYAVESDDALVLVARCVGIA